MGAVYLAPSFDLWRRTLKPSIAPLAATGPPALQVCVDPRVYVLDMPGVLPLPEVDGGERTLRLALTGAVKEGIVPEGAQMRHLLQLLLQEPRRARQLWCAADGQQAAIGGGIRESGRGGAVAAEAGMAIARALYEAVTLEMREPQGWHPGEGGGAWRRGAIQQGGGEGY